MHRRWKWVAGLAVAAVVAASVTLYVVGRHRAYVGSDADVASVKVAVPQLLAADAAVGRLPADPSLRTHARIVSVDSQRERERTISEIWAPQVRHAQAKSWNEAMAALDHHYTGYEDNRFVVTKWLGVKVHGMTATADLRGHDSYRVWGDGWRPDQTLHHRVKLWRSISDPTRWYLVDELGDVDGEFQM